MKSSEAAEKDELAKWQGAVPEEVVGRSGQSNSSCLGPSFIFTLIKVNGKQRTPAGWMRGRRGGVGRQVGVAAWVPGWANVCSTNFAGKPKRIVKRKITKTRKSKSKSRSSSTSRSRGERSEKCISSCILHVILSAWEQQSSEGPRGDVA